MNIKNSSFTKHCAREEALEHLQQCIFFSQSYFSCPKQKLDRYVTVVRVKVKNLEASDLRFGFFSLLSLNVFWWPKLW